MEYKDRFTVYLSDFVEFDTDIIKGGGVPQTKDIQKVLDFAASWGALHLIVDGAVTTERLKVHSNTTIECLNSDCGFYLADNSDVSLFENANPSMKERNDVNISFIGGTYNFNCLKQNHDISPDDKRLIRHYPVLAYEGNTYAFDPNLSVFGFKFTGVENFVMRNVTTVDQRTYSMAFCNFKHCLLENVHIRLDNNLYAQNQDGIHFYGPGQFLTLRNIRGTSGDDFIALAPDENDLESSITDVLIDGVHLDNADQGIRMLSRGKGRLDRVIVRNVTGTFKSFGFYINPWFDDVKTESHYGNILIENVDLVQKNHKYGYQKPLLFHFGGRFEKSVTLDNIKYSSEDGGHCIEIGNHYMNFDDTREFAKTEMENIFINGLTVESRGGNQVCPVTVRGKVKNMALTGISLKDTAVRAENGGEIKNLLISDGTAAAPLCKGEENISNIFTENIVLKEKI